MNNLNNLMRGYSFESSVYRNLKYLLGDEMKFIRNMKIYSYKLKRFTEIDLVVIAPYGIYCIEAKAFRTSLSGNIGDNMWLGKTGMKATRVYNTFIQNNEHIRSLRNGLRNIGVFKPPMFNNIICVPDTCRASSDFRDIYTMSQLIYKLKRDGIYEDRIYDIDYIYDLLKEVEERQ